MQNFHLNTRKKKNEIYFDYKPHNKLCCVMFLYAYDVFVQRSRMCMCVWIRTMELLHKFRYFFLSENRILLHLSIIFLLNPHLFSDYYFYFQFGRWEDARISIMWINTCIVVCQFIHFSMLFFIV